MLKLNNVLVMDNCHPSTKLWEGIFVTDVSLSVYGGPNVTITHDVLDLTVQVTPRYES